MSRRNKAQRALVQPDPVYNSRLVTLLVSRVLKSGKKSIAINVNLQSLDKALNEKDLDHISNRIISEVEKKSGAKIRS